MKSEPHRGMIWEVAGGMSEARQLSSLVKMLQFHIWRTLLRADYVSGTLLRAGRWLCWECFDRNKNKNALPLFTELMVLKGE